MTLLFICLWHIAPHGQALHKHRINVPQCDDKGNSVPVLYFDRGITETDSSLKNQLDN